MLRARSRPPRTLSSGHVQTRLKQRCRRSLWTSMWGRLVSWGFIKCLTNHSLPFITEPRAPRISLQRNLRNLAPHRNPGAPSQGPSRAPAPGLLPLTLCFWASVLHL